MVTGEAARWLEDRREELNQRFLLARRRFPALTPEEVLPVLATALPPLAEGGGAGELLDAVYDLVLLHAGRDRFATHPGLKTLLEEAFPRLRKLLLREPRSLVPALSNAVENVGARGAEYARAIAIVGAELDDPALLLRAGAVLAWRLGEARLRESALGEAEALPARALLAALALEGWPASAAPLALAALRNDAWQPPGERVSERALEALARSPEAAPQLAERLRKAPVPPLAEWRLVARVGDFSGLGGAFDVPPLLLEGSERHRLRVRCGDVWFAIDADAFGAVAVREPPGDAQVRVPEGGKGILRKLRAQARASRGDGCKLGQDGELTVCAETSRFDAIAGGSSFAALDGAVAVTHPDSHRIRVLAPWRRPL